MLDLFKAFTTQEDFFYEGAMIAKVKYQRFQSNMNSITYKNEVIKNSSKLSVVSCSGYANNEIAEKLTVTLIMNAKVKEDIDKEIYSDFGHLWYTFSKEEITDFSYMTGDKNSIHLSENPVVQGLFILKKLCVLTQANEIEVKYTYPVYGETPVYLKHEENHILGYSNNRLCFRAVV